LGPADIFSAVDISRKPRSSGKCSKDGRSLAAAEQLNVIVRWRPMPDPAMIPDRAMILQHLEQARRLVAERHIAHEREIIAEKERDGHDTTRSKQLLAEFEHFYRLHVAERDRLEKELVAAST
jgi:hypothetical protein